MIEPKHPENEKERQLEVEKYKLLDTLPEERYDNLTSVMAYVCDVPVSLISILDRDRNYLKSHHGVPFNEDPRARSFCGHTILEDSNIMVVEDASKDKRFHDNPLVTDLGIRFYAGASLVNPGGFKLGTLCVFDTKPRNLNEKQKETLEKLANQVMLLMEHHLQHLRLKEVKERLEKRNNELKKFAAMVSHDLKSPLSNIQGLTDLVSQSLIGKADEETKKYLDLIRQSSESLASYVDGVLSYYKSEELLKRNQTEVSVQELSEDISNVFASVNEAHIEFDSSIDEITTNKGALMQVLVNLISNGIKYNDRDLPSIEVKVNDEASYYHFAVVDNGVGMNGTELEIAFELFETNNKKDRNGKPGSGIGLATVKKLLQNLGGDIWLKSQEGEGTTAHFTLPKNKS